jgi:hypothetical protein
MTFIVGLFGVLTLGVLLVVFGTVTKNRWGVNFDRTICPTCKAGFTRVRKPKSLDQALWGGSTCNACGSESDKWGRLIAKPDKP